MPGLGQLALGNAPIPQQPGFGQQQAPFGQQPMMNPSMMMTPGMGMGPGMGPGMGGF